MQRSVKSCSQRKNYNKLTTFDRKKADIHIHERSAFQFLRKIGETKNYVLGLVNILVSLYIWKKYALNQIYDTIYLGEYIKFKRISLPEILCHDKEHIYSQHAYHIMEKMR